MPAGSNNCAACLWRRQRQLDSSLSSNDFLAGETAEQIEARKLEHSWGVWLKSDSSDGSDQTGGCCSSQEEQELMGTSKMQEDAAPHVKVNLGRHSAAATECLPARTQFWECHCGCSCAQLGPWADQLPPLVAECIAEIVHCLQGAGKDGRVTDFFPVRKPTSCRNGRPSSGKGQQAAGGKRKATEVVEGAVLQLRQEDKPEEDGGMLTDADLPMLSSQDTSLSRLAALL